MIRLTSVVWREVRAHASAAYPRECCGALLGGQLHGSRDVSAALPLDNQSDPAAARRRFLVTPEDYRRAERTADGMGLALLGFYHSHPDHPAIPSDFDLAHALPWFSYLIVGVVRGEPGEMSCWLLADDRSRFETEPMEVLPCP